MGFLSIVTINHIHIKLDPITYDEDHNIIPLSQRFNTENDDIRYQRRDTDIPVDPTHPDVELAMSIKNTDNMLDLIANGKKTVETRENKSAFNMFKGKTVGLLDRATNKIVAYAKVSDKLKEYNTYEEFRKDFKNHKVPAKSTFDMKKGKDGKWIKKYGIVFDKVEKLDTPIEAKGRNFALGKTMYYTPTESNTDVKYQAKLYDNDIEKLKKMSYNEYRSKKLAFERGNAAFGSHIQLYNSKSGMLEIWEKGDDIILKVSSRKINTDAGVLYERTYRTTANTVYECTESFESSKGKDNWDSKFSGYRGDGLGNASDFESKGLQSDSTRSGADLPEDNSGEFKVNNDERSTDNDGAFFDAKNQLKDTTPDIDLDVIRSLTEANKQLTKELGKAQVTNEKIIERAEKLADKRKAKAKQKQDDLRKLVKLSGPE